MGGGGGIGTSPVQPPWGGPVEKKPVENPVESVDKPQDELNEWEWKPDGEE